MDSEGGRPGELDEGALAFGVDEGEGVDSETLHHAVGAGDTTVGHGPEEHVRRLGAQVDEVPEVVVGSLGLGDFKVGLGLGGVDDVREFHAIWRIGASASCSLR